MFFFLSKRYVFLLANQFKYVIWTKTTTAFIGPFVMHSYFKKEICYHFIFFLKQLVQVINKSSTMQHLKATTV